MLTGSSTDEFGDDEQVLAELEEAFKDRYTETDEEYQQAIAQAIPPPPVVIPWTGRSKRRNDWSRDRSNWNRRGGYHDNYHNNSYRSGGGGRDDYGYQKSRRTDDGRNYNRYQDSGPYQDGRYQNLGRYQEFSRYWDNCTTGGRNQGYNQGGPYNRGERRHNNAHHPYRRT